MSSSGINDFNTGGVLYTDSTGTDQSFNNNTSDTFNIIYDSSIFEQPIFEIDWDDVDSPEKMFEVLKYLLKTDILKVILSESVVEEMPENIKEHIYIPKENVADKSAKEIAKLKVKGYRFGDKKTT